MSGVLISFRLADGRGAHVIQEWNGPNIDELRIVIVVTLAGTAFDSINKVDLGD